jgi:hypothetical protein
VGLLPFTLRRRNALRRQQQYLMIPVYRLMDSRRLDKVARLISRRRINHLKAHMSQNSRVNQSAIKLVALLLVNHCKIQPVYQLVSYDEIKHIIQFDPHETREGRAIVRQALRDLLKDGFVFLVKRGYGIYLAKRIRYHIVVR